MGVNKIAARHVFVGPARSRICQNSKYLIEGRTGNSGRSSIEIRRGRGLWAIPPVSFAIGKVRLPDRWVLQGEPQQQPCQRLTSAVYGGTKGILFYINKLFLPRSVTKCMVKSMFLTTCDKNPVIFWENARGTNKHNNTATR